MDLIICLLKVCKSTWLNPAQVTSKHQIQSLCTPAQGMVLEEEKIGETSLLPAILPLNTSLTQRFKNLPFPIPCIVLFFLRTWNMYQKQQNFSLKRWQILQKLILLSSTKELEGGKVEMLLYHNTKSQSHYSGQHFQFELGH